MDDVERLLQCIARYATRAESLERAGALSSQAAGELCVRLYRARDVAQAEQVARELEELPATAAEPLDVARVRAELRPLDCGLERTYPENYAGFRIVADDTRVEFGFRADLLDAVVPLRQAVTFPARVGGFRARFALVELRYALAMIQRGRTHILERSIKLTSLRLSVADNRVVVGVRDDVERASVILRDEFGPAVVVERRYGGIAG